LSAPRWFYYSHHALRWPWRIALFLAATLICGVVAQYTVVPVLNVLFSWLGLRAATEPWLYVAALLGAHLVMLKFVESRSWSSVWLATDAARPAVLARGFAFGALAIGIPVLLVWAIGWMDRVPGPPGSWVTSTARTSLDLLPSAFLEELASRGYIFATLCARFGWRTAIVVTSLAFGLLHLGNPGVSAQSVTLVVLAGVFLAMVLWATRSLYAATLAHFAWNWMLACVFHTPVSGYVMETPDYRLVDDGPDWATGGQWGPEGGAAGGIGMLAGLGYLYARRIRPRREDA
jgi:membrane protease YdiL (CAAX protease family)